MVLYFTFETSVLMPFNPLITQASLLAQMQGNQQAVANRTATTMASGDFETQLLALEKKLAAKDEIIEQLGEKLNKNMQDYASQVMFCYMFTWSSIQMCVHCLLSFYSCTAIGLNGFA